MRKLRYSRWTPITRTDDRSARDPSWSRRRYIVSVNFLLIILLFERDFTWAKLWTRNPLPQRAAARRYAVDGTAFIRSRGRRSWWDPDRPSCRRWPLCCRTAARWPPVCPAPACSCIGRSACGCAGAFPATTGRAASYVRDSFSPGRRVCTPDNRYRPAPVLCCSAKLNRNDIIRKKNKIHFNLIFPDTE